MWEWRCGKAAEFVDMIHMECYLFRTHTHTNTHKRWSIDRRIPQLDILHFTYNYYIYFFLHFNINHMNGSAQLNPNKHSTFVSHFDHVMTMLGKWFSFSLCHCILFCIYTAHSLLYYLSSQIGLKVRWYRNLLTISIVIMNQTNCVANHNIFVIFSKSETFNQR